MTVSPRAGDFPAEETKFYSAATLLAMEYVHSQNMVYRDLKPENILIDTSGYVRVVDFGFAKRLVGEQPTRAPRAPSSSFVSRRKARARLAGSRSSARPST